MSDKTDRLKLETPVSGSFGWHEEWGRNMDILDSHPGVSVYSSLSRPSSPWAGQVIFETDTKLPSVFDGASWRYLNLAPVAGPFDLFLFSYSPPSGDSADFALSVYS